MSLIEFMASGSDNAAEVVCIGEGEVDEIMYFCLMTNPASNRAITIIIVIFKPRLRLGKIGHTKLDIIAKFLQ